jgi:hypothetical protein
MGENFGLFKSFGDKLFEGELPTNLGLIGSTTLNDADAQAFFNRVSAAGGSLTATEQDAVNTLVFQMKAAGIWTGMKAIYPMVGGSAAACAQNLKSSSFTGTFSSGWTFSSLGVTGNGTSAYMDTNFKPSTNFTSLNNKSFGVYVGTNTDVGIEMAVVDGSYVGDQLISRITGVLTFAVSSAVAALITSLDSRGFWIATRLSNSSADFYKNTSIVVSSGASSSQTNFNFYIGARHYNNAFANAFSNKRIQFGFMGDGLDNTQASDLYTAVQAFQTTLSRQV